MSAVGAQQSSAVLAALLASAHSAEQQQQPQQQLLAAWPLLSHTAFSRTGLSVLGAGSANAAQLHRLYARIGVLLESAQGADCWAAMQCIKHVAASAPAVVEAAAGSSAATAARDDDDDAAGGVSTSGAATLRPHLDRWSKFLFRLLKQLLEPRATASGTTSLPPLHPVLALAAFETEQAVLSRVVHSWGDMRREASNTTVPGLLPLLLKMITRSEGRAQNDKTAAAQTQVGSWPFIPPGALVRSLRVLLAFVREFKTALRPFVDRIRETVLPVLVHAEDDEAREVAADVLASCTLIQSGAAAAAAAKKKEQALKAAAASSNAAGDDDDLAAEEEARATSLAAQAQSNRLVIPDDPWSTLVQSTLNSLHAHMDELDEAGDGPAQQGADRPWMALPRCTEEVLALPALPKPANAASAPFARAHAMQLQLSGLFELLSALLSSDLFARMHASNASTVTVAVPVQHLLALLRRFAAQDVNPHTLQHITGRALPRAGLVLLRAATLERALDLLDDLVDLAGASLTPFIGQIGEIVKELLARCAFVEQGKEQRHALPRLLPRVYQTAASLLRRFGPGALLYPFVLPVLSTALTDIERPVRMKNLQLQLQRNLSSMAAFTGAALSHKEKRQSGGGGGGSAKQSSDADPSALFLESAHMDLAVVIACAALEFLDAALVSCGAALPVQKRVSVDRSLVSVCLAFQAQRWSVLDSFRRGVLQALLTSMTTPASAAAVAKHTSGSSVGGGAANTSTGANGLLSAFALLPYAVQLFTHAARHDSSPIVSALASQALRVAASLTHPRAFALQSHAGAFVQDHTLAPLGEDHSTLDLSGDAGRLAPGLVRGRDGSLYMRMDEAPSQGAEDAQQESNATAQEGASASFSASAAAAAAASSTSAVAPRVGQKRAREEESEEQADADMQVEREGEEDDSAAQVPPAKRANLGEASIDAPAAAAAVEDPQPQSTPATLPPAGELSRPAHPSDDEPDDSDGAGVVDDGEGEEEDEGEEGDAPVAVVDDGPDEDEGAQGSLWNL